MAEVQDQITLYQYRHEEEDGEQTQTASIARIARSLDAGQLAKLLDDWLNYSGMQFDAGYAVGHQLRRSHRTIQRSAVALALGILSGISEQEFTDERNATAIATAKKVKELVENGQLPLGMHL